MSHTHSKKKSNINPSEAKTYCMVVFIDFQYLFIFKADWTESFKVMKMDGEFPPALRCKCMSHSAE